MMNTDTSISLALIFSIVSVLGVVSSMYNNHRKNRQAEERKEIEIEKNFVTLNLKIDALAKTISEMNDAAKEQRAEMKRVNESVAHIEEQIKTLFTRVENLEKGINNY